MTPDDEQRAAPGRRHRPRARAAGRAWVAAVALLAVIASAVGAQEGGEDAEDAEAGEDGKPRFVLNGFGTVGLTGSSERDADYVVSPRRPDGPGATREWSAEVDSRLGLQLTADFTPKLSAVVQVIVEQQHDDEVEPTVEWANLKYSFTENLSVRLGRTALPTFASADYRKVGFANPWVRPPVDLYSLVPIFNSDGLDLSYRHRFAGWTHTVQATVGRSDVDLPGDDVVAEIRELVGLFDTFERGGLSLRTALATAEVTLDAAAPLFDAFRLFGPEGVAIAERFDIAEKRVDFAAVGASWDPGDWFLIAELGRIRTPSAIGDRTAGYLTAGRRWGALTAYATFSEARSDGNSSSGLTLSALPPELRAPAAGLNAALAEQLAAIAAQRTVSLGLRWDYRRNAALKLQVDRVDVGAGSFGTFVNRQPGFATGGGATLVTLNTDFVF